MVSVSLKLSLFTPFGWTSSTPSLRVVQFAPFTCYCRSKGKLFFSWQRNAVNVALILVTWQRWTLYLKNWTVILCFCKVRPAVLLNIVPSLMLVSKGIFRARKIRNFWDFLYLQMFNLIQWASFCFWRWMSWTFSTFLLQSMVAMEMESKFFTKTQIIKITFMVVVHFTQK